MPSMTPSGAVAFMFGRPKISGHTAHDAGGLRFEVVEPYVERYLAAAPGWARARGQGFSIVLGGGFPRLAARAETAQALSEALAGDVPTVLRRAWEDHLDDLNVALAARQAWAAQA